MITAISWVPKGAAKNVPEVAEQPSQEEIEELLRSGALDGDAGSDEDADMDVDAPGEPGEADEVARALAAAKALGKGKAVESYRPSDVIASGLRELNLENYDEEVEEADLLSAGRGDRFYESNDLDPHITKNDDQDDDDDDDDDDDEEKEDMTIKATDLVIVCAKNEDEVNLLEVWIYEEDEDGNPNVYPHHYIIIPDYPLCTAWMDCSLKGGDKGNFIAVGSMGPAIEIFDLDLIDELRPHMVLGGAKKKKEKGKKAKNKFKKGSHRDSVLGLAWNQEVRNVLASASADNTVKIWDVAAGKCAMTLEHHDHKVQAVAWSRHSPEVLLSGSFDKSVAMMDMKDGGQGCSKWSVEAEVESLAWDPHNEHSFLVSLDNGTVQAFDKRTASSNSPSASKPKFTLHAHEDAVCSISFGPSAPNLLATASTDKMVKLWDLSDDQPSCIASQNLKAGAVFSATFSNDSPFLLAIGGSKGILQVWDTLTEPGVVNKFGKYSSRKPDPTTEG